MNTHHSQVLYRLISITLLLFLSACASKATLNGDTNASIGDPAPTLGREPDTLKLLVIGGTSGIGLEVVNLALDRGHQVTAVSRRPERLSLAHPALTITKGDITLKEDMQRLVPTHDVIIMSAGLAAGSRNVTVFSEGISNVRNVMEQNAQQRIITVSAIGAGDSKGHGGFIFDNLLQPLILGDDIEDKERMEQLLLSSSLDFTVVRPAILTDDEAMMDYRVINDLKGIETGTIARKDVAHFIIAASEQNIFLKELVTLSN